MVSTYYLDKLSDQRGSPRIPFLGRLCELTSRPPTFPVGIRESRARKPTQGGACDKLTSRRRCLFGGV